MKIIVNGIEKEIDNFIDADGNNIETRDTNAKAAKLAAANTAKTNKTNAITKLKNLGLSDDEIDTLITS